MLIQQREILNLYMENDKNKKKYLGSFQEG